jgi:hypothetical protein
MRAVRAAIGIFFTLTFIFFIIPTSSAATVITLTEKPHRDLMGKFSDDSLAGLITPNGRLGQLVFAAPTGAKKWVIDTALIDEINAMSTPYKFGDGQTGTGTDLAKNWLAALRTVTRFGDVEVMPYANADAVFLKRFAPSELRFYCSAAQSKLELALERAILPCGENTGTSAQISINQSLVDSYTMIRKETLLLNTAVPAGSLDQFRMELAKVFAVGLSKSERSAISESARLALESTYRNLMVVPGKYRLTSEHEKVPVTLINNYLQPVTVDLDLFPLNSRIRISNIKNITIPAKSKIQITVPVTVIASGSVEVLAQFKNSKGVEFGKSSALSLNLSVISPRVTWFTTGSGILLLLGATAQSVRRIKKSRK